MSRCVRERAWPATGSPGGAGLGVFHRFDGMCELVKPKRGRPSVKQQSAPAVAEPAACPSARQALKSQSAVAELASRSDASDQSEVRGVSVAARDDFKDTLRHRQSQKADFDTHIARQKTFSLPSFLSEKCLSIFLVFPFFFFSLTFLMFYF